MFFLKNFKFFLLAKLEYYDNSIAENLFLANELKAVGMEKTKLSSLSWYATNSTGYLQQNISIWMANVSETNLDTGNSHLTSGMTLVYTGSCTPQIGWNEFEFNESDFVWDGVSNLLVCVQRNNGAYNSTIYWQSHTANFTATAYAYRDGTSYSTMFDTYSMNKTSTRPNIIFKGGMFYGSHIEDMTVSAGTYYLVTSSTSDAWEIEINTDTLTCPNIVTNPTPENDDTIVNPTAVRLQWLFGERSTEYQLLLGTDNENLDTIVDWTRDLNESYILTGLLNNTNYFWQVIERNDGCPEGVEGPVWEFATLLNGPDNVHALNSQLYEVDTLHIEWTPMTDTNIVSYNIYQDNVLIGNTTENAYAVNGLTYNMDGYDFYVSGVYAGGESNPINTVSVQVSGNGSVAGHVYEQDGITPIQSAKVAFSGYDEYGNNTSITFITDATGLYSGNMLAGTYQATATCAGYQDAALPENVTITYNTTTTTGVDFILDEYYYPVNNVTASYYPEADNPNSQYVKVEWSNDASGWLYFDNGINYNGIGAGTTQFYWGVKFDVHDYENYCLTKVSMYDYANFEGKILIFQTNGTPSGTPLLQQSFTGNATNDFVEYALNTPLIIDSSLPLWIVMHRLSGDTYVASTCLDQGDPNGRWYSPDCEEWHDLTEYNLYYTWMLRGYVTNSVRGERMLANSAAPQHNTPDVIPDNVTVPQKEDAHPHFVGTPKHIAQSGTRSFQHYRVYRTDYYNDGPFTEDNTVLIADNITDAYYIDDTWTAAAPGVYKWGVSCVYEGNRETPIRWGEQNPVNSGDDPNGPAPFVTVPEDSDLPILRTEYSKAIVARWHHGNDFGSFILNNPSESQSLGFTNNVFTNGACTMNGILYFSDSNGKFGIIDPQNGLNVIATGRPFTVIDDNPVDGKMYGCDHDGNLYEINPVDGSYTELANIPVSTLITFTITNDGRFIICDRGDETIKEYFPATGTLITLFTMDWNIEYGQDMATDRETNEVYWAAYNNSNTTMPLIKIDLDNHQLTTLGYFDGQVSAFAITNIHQLNVGRESRAVWSGAVDKNMYLADGDVNVTVTLNSGDNPEGVMVHFTNLNATEQQLYPVTDITLDATGHYAWDSFRRGDYRVTISKADYGTTVDVVSIWDATALNYVLSEINYGLTDLYVSRTGWAMWTDEHHGNTVPSLDSEPTADAFFIDFEDGMPEDWTTIDADNDGYTWLTIDRIGEWGNKYQSGTFNWAHNGNNSVLSASYLNEIGVLYPDNYLVSPKVHVESNSHLSFWAAAVDMYYAADHFGIAVSTGSNTNANDFVMVQEWTMTAKGGQSYKGGERNNNTKDINSWYYFDVDLGAYVGQDVYLAFRHFNCSDQYIISIDDIEFGNNTKSNGNRHFNNYQVVLSDTENNVIYQGAVTDCFMQLPTENLTDGETYRLKVAADYSSGPGNWKIVDWTYQSCGNFEAVTDLNMQMSDTANVISWTYPTVDNRNILTNDCYAFVCNNGGGTYSNGWLGFDVETPNNYTLVNTDLRLFGGDYCVLDGFVYSTYNGYWYKINPKTGGILESGYIGTNFYDCAWDDTSETMFGVNGSYLYKWNIVDKTRETIGYMDNTFEVLACDNDGQLWGIAIGGYLYKIGKTNASNEYVGNTGLSCDFNWQSGGFDHYTNKLYWYGAGFFAEVDTQTGAANIISSNTGSSNHGTFCVPYYSDYIPPVTGILGALLYRDGELLGFTTSDTYTDIIATGNHEYEIRVVYDGVKRPLNINAYYAMSCPTSIGGTSYDVTAAAVPEEGGTVTGSGTYINGFPCTVTATESDGFAFTNWTINDQVVATTPEYTFIVTDSVIIEANFIGYTPHWTVVDNPEYEPASLIGVVQINGVEQGANYIEVAAICGNECRGRQMMAYYPEQNRYLLYLTIYGNDNDQITFDLYDHNKGQETEFACLTELTFITNETFGSMTDPFVIEFGVRQETPMQTGWNWFASAVDIDSVAALEMLENSLGTDGVMIKSQTEGFVMNYENYWVGNLNYVSNNQMYMIKVNAQTNATLKGYQTDIASHNITIYPNWTWLGYPSNNALDVNDALADFDAKDGDILKTKQSFSSYVEGLGWMGSLQTLNPGQGLMYYSTRNVAVTLTYSDQGNRQELIPNITAENNHWIPNAFEYPDNMSMMAVVEIDGAEVVDDNYELAVFDGSKCVGSAKLVFVESISRYVSFLTISDEEGSELQFGLFDGSTGEELFNATDIVTFVPNAIIGSLDQPYIVNFKEMTGVSENYKNPNIYPNPVSRSTQFRIDIASSKANNMTVEIVDALGKTVSTNQSSNMPVTMTAPAAAGVYVIKIHVDGNETYCRKLIVK